MSMDSDTITLQSLADNAPANDPDQSSETPFSCNVCKKSYTRVDHLARHYRSHTKERPFICQVCGKSFGRIDLLKRHAANHGDEEDAGAANANGEPASKRRKTLPGAQTHKPRATQACRACAESKLRCDGSRPCLRCTQRSMSCEYPHHSRTSKSSLNNSTVSAQEILQSIPNAQISNDSAASAPETQKSLPLSVEMAGSNPINYNNQVIDFDGQDTTFQLPPTPSTFGQGLSSLPSSTAYAQDVMVHFEDLPLFDFFRESQTAFDGAQSLVDDPFPRDVLDFGIDLSLDTPNIFDPELQINAEDPLPMSLFNPVDYERPANRSGIATPGLRGNLNIMASAQAFKESLWLWTPEKHHHGALEQYNLSLPWENLSPDSRLQFELCPINQGITNMIRGKILALILRTCEPVIYSHVVSNFPSTEFLTSLVQHFVSFHSQQDMMWIHPGTIQVGRESAEFLTSIISYGAAISHVPEIRKLGFAMQEAVRIANPLEFERDNRTTRELRPLQSFALHLDVGLWSGDRRKMEISESFAMPLLTMVRRAGHYRRTRVSELPPQQEDIGEALESKWQNWAKQESFKRLALYLFYRDTRSSMSLLSQPLISYAELSTELPCSRELWLAKTAIEWKTVYLAQNLGEDKRNLSIRTCMDDSSAIFGNERFIDVDLSLLLIVATVWPLLWQYREMRSTAKFRTSMDPRNSALTMNSRHQEVQQILKHIQLTATEFVGCMKPAAWLLYEQCLMHLYVSLEDVQLLAGKEGEEEARKAFPILSAWVESSEARQALHHAGQVIRAAREYPKFLLRDASAVAVYHASLVFWAYAVLSKNENSSQSGLNSVRLDGERGLSFVRPDGERGLSFVRLDGEDGPELQRYLVLGRGIPCIQRRSEGEDTDSVQDIPLSEPAEVMSAITKLLQRQHDAGDRSCPPLIENLSKLMHSLGRAARGRRER